MKKVSLEKAAKAAVKSSTTEISKLEAKVELLIELLKKSTAEIGGARLDLEEHDLGVKFSGYLDDTITQVRDLFDRQLAAIQKFNIVLFGRTGAGKSTLISAMTRGNGEAVSQGESDWTTQVAPLDWHSCRIYDTPGINGWGRTESRSDLEEKARKAVEIADFVLICFDSQSQQADEFKKLAVWVQSYRKPLIAILNIRNAVWRLPPRVPVGSARMTLSQSVREHQGSISDELAKIGLSGVPVIALSSKRALFARATLPFRGPDELSLEKQRTQFGVQKLETWSGFERFEKLLVESISHHSVSLRVGALNNQLRGVFNNLRESLTTVELEANQAAEIVENDLIGKLLNLLGYPPRDDKERRRPLMSGKRDLLHKLEQSRNGAFQAPVEGEFRQLVRQRLDVELGSLRTQSLQKAEECVINAFEKKKSLSADNVCKATFDEEEMKGAAECVLKEGDEFLQRRTELSLRDTKLNLKVLSRGVTVKGDAGLNLKYRSVAIQTGSILAGAAGVLGSFAIANIWNPFGWGTATAAGVILATSVAATLLGWLGGKGRKKAEKNKLEARRQALAEVRSNIHEVYDSFRDEVLIQAHKHVLAGTEKLLKPPIEQALLHRNVQHQCTSLCLEIDRLTNDLQHTGDPQALICNTASEIEVAAYPNDANRSRQFWLGEDWVTDPDGLSQTKGSAKPEPTSAYNPDIFDNIFEGFKRIFDQITENLKPGTGNKWLNGALERCSDDSLALEALEELKNIITDGQPRIHLVGDYNAGKSSFIKRLLLDSGDQTPPDLEVRANPTTDRAYEYDWNGVRLIDTPGFQSGEATHTEYALRTFPDASAVIYLFQPNLVLGDDENLINVLCGNRELGLVPKQERTFFVVNRSDELGVDPETDPDQFGQLVNRKKAELCQALGSRGITVDADSVFCMASDPFGLVGNRSDVDSRAFTAFRAWDGFGHFMSEFRRARSSLLRTGVDRSILDGGIARLSRLEARQIEEVAELAGQDEASARLQLQIQEAIADGTRIGRKLQDDLQQLVNDHSAGLRLEILAEENSEQLKIKAERLGEWWNDKALQVELKHWAKKATEELNGWRRIHSEAIERRFESSEFRAAFGNHTQAAPDLSYDENGKKWFMEGFQKVGSQLGKANRDVVLKIGKSMGYKFKPWGAVKLAKNLGKVAAVMAVAGVLMDIVEFVQAGRKEKKREDFRKNVGSFLSDSATSVVDTVARGTEEEPGVLRMLETANKELREIEAEQTNIREQLATGISQARTRISIYTSLKEEAYALLGNPLK